MTREEITRNLKHTMEKHKNDNVPTFGTDISLMCKDILDYLEQEHCEKQKKGKWMTNSDIPDRFICSCCDSQYNMYFWEQDDMHYCPNCGAEMESEE